MTGKKADDDTSPCLVLFRSDLRVADNRALHAAAATGKPILPVFILDDESEGVRPRGAASRWWLHQSLEALSGEMEKLGAKLLLLKGKQNDIVHDLIERTGANTVFWNRRYDAACERDQELKTELQDQGLTVESFDGMLLHEPTRLTTGSGTPFKVFTPFWRALDGLGDPRDPASRPRKLRALDKTPRGDTLKSWDLLPTRPNWAKEFAENWQPGEKGAHAALDEFLDHAIDGYAKGRDLPSEPATSRLSPHLAAGEITPFQIFHALRSRKIDAPHAEIAAFRRELGWREFNHHLLFHNRDLATKNYNKSFDAFEWHHSKADARKWQQGMTGYPIVDAGMRQLWRTGWMHNRIRMVVASFLIKHLVIDWRDGEKWFWDTLVDADIANNPGNWQWVAGSGADASPFFRIFNPILQGEKFDPNGDYVRSFVPELADMPAKYIHKPWEAPKEVLAKAGVKLGNTYPVPMVDHKEARDRALSAYRATRGNT